jgi:hypothetical protein
VTAVMSRSDASPTLRDCRRCGYDLAGLPPTTGGSDQGLCPECGLRLRLSRRPWLSALNPRDLKRLSWGIRLAGLGFDLVSAAVFMIVAMMIIGSHYWLDPGSVPALNAVVAVCGLVGWLLTFAGSSRAVVRDPVDGRRHGALLALWTGLAPIACLLVFPIPFVIVGTAWAADGYLRYLRRASSARATPKWADPLKFLGLIGAVSTVVLGLFWLPELGASRHADGTVVELLAMFGATYQYYAWALRRCGRDIRRITTLDHADDRLPLHRQQEV